MTSQAICVFCGSRFGSDEQYRRLAEDVGRDLARAGVTLVYGGGNLGLMGTVSNAALDAGGAVTGIIPGFLHKREMENPRLTRTIHTQGMFDRKQAMFDLSDGFLVLPGGLGTMDELFEVLTWRQLGQLDKPLVLLAEDDFWAPYTALVDHILAREYASESIRNLYQVERSIPAAFEALGVPAATAA